MTSYLTPRSDEPLEPAVLGTASGARSPPASPGPGAGACAPGTALPRQRVYTLTSRSLPHSSPTGLRTLEIKRKKPLDASIQ